MTTESDPNAGAGISSAATSENPNPAGPPNPPATPQTPPQNAGSSAGNGPSFTEVMNGLNALPERIVDSLREAMQPATPPAPQGGQGNSATTAQNSTAASTTSSENAPSSTKPGKKSFGEWWFGR